MEHTPEPWTGDEASIAGPGEWNPICHASYEDSDSTPHDMRRIVACVNACQGINPEAVPELLGLAKGYRVLMAKVISEKGDRFGLFKDILYQVDKVLAKAEEVQP